MLTNAHSVGYTSDPQVDEHAVQFDDAGRVSRGYRGRGWDGQGDAEGPGKVVKGLSGEAVRILKEPGLHLPSLTYPTQQLIVLARP